MHNNFSDITHLTDDTKQNKHRSSDGAASGDGPEKVSFPSIRHPEASTDHIEMQEVVEHSHDKQLDEFVESKPESIALDKELEDAGVTSNNQTNFPTYEDIKLPISDEKIVKGLKSPTSSSLRWLAEMCVFLLKRGHVHLKTVHGKVVRIFDGKKN